MSYNCLRGAYEKLKLVLCISKAPLWHPWGSAKALLTRTQTKQSFVLPHLFSSPVSIFLIRVFTFLHMFVARLALLYTSGAVFGFVFHLFVSRLSLFWLFFVSWEGPKESPPTSWHWFGFWVTPWKPHLGGQGGGHTLWWNWTRAQCDEELEVR